VGEILETEWEKVRTLKSYIDEGDCIGWMLVGLATKVLAVFLIGILLGVVVLVEVFVVAVFKDWIMR